MPVTLLLLLLVAAGIDPGAIEGTFMMVVVLSPVWLPLYLGQFFWTTWIHYIRFANWFSIEKVLIEIQLPPEVVKSPAAMELFLGAMWNAGGEPTFIARLWHGKFRPVWSLEIASTEGQVRFYIHLPAGFKDVLEARLYGQYPEAQVRVVDDYVGRIPFNLEEYDLWGLEYDKSEPEALPIRTYVDYALDKNTDTPEIQVDPITSLVEFFGSIGPGEHLWLQIIMRARKKDEWYGFYLSGDHYKDQAAAGIKKITEGAIKRAQGLTTDEAEQKKVGSRGAMLLTGGEKEQVEAIERMLTKNLFECGLRGLYVARKDKFRGINIPHLVQLFTPYLYPEFGRLGPGPVSRGLAIFDYPWQDWNGIRASKIKKNLFFFYKHRAYHYVPYDQVPVFLTTEELATIWHFPSSVVKSPSLERVGARVSEGPSNLPTGL